MEKRRYLTIPNGLSLSRLVLLPVLYVFVFRRMDTAFVVGYALLGVTDYLDGLIARKFNQKSDVGKALDSIADLPFYISTAYFMARLFPQYLRPNRVLLFVFFGVLAASFVISAVRWRKPVLMHTFVMRKNAVLVYFCMLLSFYVNTTILIAVILVIYMVGLAESIIIFLRHPEVDQDSLSMFHLIEIQKK
jgi:phosphatidylglycerophosphate synthase